MLVDIPDDEISNFVHVLEQEHPQSFFVINFIETCHKWKRKNGQLKISLFYTENSMKTGIFIGVLRSGCIGILITFYALNGHENDLEETLKHIPIEWENINRFEGIAEKHVPIVETLISDRCLEMTSIPLLAVCMPIEEARNLDISCPEEVELGPLNEHHAVEMYNAWLMKTTFTIDALINSIRYNDEAAYGVFCRKTGDLLARCVRSHSGFLAALQTVDKARNKGYAKLLLKYIAKKMAERRMVACSYTAEFNQAAINIFCSIGYKEVCKMRSFVKENP